MQIYYTIHVIISKLQDACSIQQPSTLYSLQCGHINLQGDIKKHNCDQRNDGIEAISPQKHMAIINLFWVLLALLNDKTSCIEQHSALFNVTQISSNNAIINETNTKLNKERVSVGFNILIHTRILLLQWRNNRCFIAKEPVTTMTVQNSLDCRTQTLWRRK